MPLPLSPRSILQLLEEQAAQNLHQTAYVVRKGSTSALLIAHHTYRHRM